MSNFYFFTDPGSLDVQDPTQAFGPADPLSSQDRFRVTDVHTSSSAALPAIAICEGVLCAQEEGPDTLTLILKPSQAPPFESPIVSYFIYKGVDKASLLNGDKILAEDAVRATDFTKRIAKEWKKQNADDLAGSSAALGLDRNASFLHDDGTSQVHIFTDNDPIDRLFTYPHKTVQLPIVAAGEEIGGFQSIGGFEVHLQRLGYKPKLEFARRIDNQISVASLAADNNGTPWVADDSEFFAHWHAKEQVLAFMDPCAYFGSFVQAKLSKKSGSGAGTVKGSDIYQEILQRFANRNIAWLDIRNNYSYSYNLFGLYDDTIRFVHHSDASQTSDKNFRSGSWPILKLQIADVPGSKRGSLHRTKLSLPVGQSTAPAVLVSKGFVKNLGPERPKSKAPAIARASPDDTNYTPFRLALPVTVDNSDPVFTASYTRINIYEKPHPSQPGAALLDVAGGDYLDGVFRPRDLQLDKDFAGNSLRFEVFPEEVLIDLEEENGPAYSATVGIVEDADCLALFTFPSYFLTNDSEAGQPWAVASWTDSAGNPGANLQTWLKNKFLRATITKATTNPGAQNELDLVIVRTSDPGARAALDGLGNIIDYSFIIFKKDDYMSFLAQIDDDADWGTVLTTFLTIATTVTRQDTTSTFTYLAKTMQATGYARNSNSAAKLVRLSMSYSKEVLGYADF
jgi:hypothetical protein